ncbi:NEDD8-activating enzyme E1 regulatory subunit AXL [Camellia lanceoleosa]|nr:NEDD8-activating enzyme E1 regulatory subunit AXL [Camellia lanceoleosa]
MGEGGKKRGVASADLPQPHYRTFQGVSNHPPPPHSQPSIGFPQPVPPPGAFEPYANAYQVFPGSLSLSLSLSLSRSVCLAEDSMVKLDRICREANVMLIFAHSYGLTGFVRISVKMRTLPWGGKKRYWWDGDSVAGVGCG